MTRTPISSATAARPTSAEQLERLSARVRRACRPVERGAPVHARGARGGGRATTARPCATGAPLIYQAQFFDGRWQGRADFLRRIDAPSELGRPRLRGARHQARAAGQAARRPPAQPLQPAARPRSRAIDPRYAHVVLGDGATSAVDLRPLRRAASPRRPRSLEPSSPRRPTPTYPEPVAHCAICALADECRDAPRRRRPPQPRRRRAARPARAPRRRSASRRSPRSPRRRRRSIPGRSATSASTLLHHQAACRSRRATTRRADCTATSRRRAPPATRCFPSRARATSSSTSRATPTSATDGASSTSGAGGPPTAATSASWAHDADAEKAAFERFVDRVVALRAQHPGHARLPLRAARALEAAVAVGQVRDARGRGRRPAARRACSSTSTRVVRQGAAGRRGELLAQEARAPPRLRAPGDSACARAAARSSPTRRGWRPATPSCSRRSAPTTRRTAARRCRCATGCSTTMRPEAEARVRRRLRRAPRARARGAARPAGVAARRQRAHRAADAGLPAHGEDDTPTEAERRLLAHLLLYHRREGKPAWWRLLRPARTSRSVELDRRARRARRTRAATHDVEPVPFKTLARLHVHVPAAGVQARRSAMRCDPTTGEDATTSSPIEDDRVVPAPRHGQRRRRRRRRSSATAPIDGGGRCARRSSRSPTELLDGDGRFAGARGRSSGASRRASRSGRLGAGRRRARSRPRSASIGSDLARAGPARAPARRSAARA